MSRQHMLPVWFFIGVLLFAYGVIILITTLCEWSHPLTLVLAEYHPGLWGGIVLLAIGGLYMLRFWPRNR
jgi:hypothetical protein